ncbi:endoglucanase [Sphingomonas sp. CARO-RG-8B-R24-01]|uniref:endoglucanase n=1 Tax=Sphingomonas sp. CARO-RG-8B-R24-01 TaxID=2914831 RepID=UPI001F57636B
MIRSRHGLLALSVALIGTAPAPVTGPTDPSPPVVPRTAPLAAVLAEQALPARDGRWPRIPDAIAWTAIARSTPDTRQAARWTLAQSLIAQERMADASGVLDTMVGDDPALALTAAWRLAHGVVLAALNHPHEALQALGMPALADHPEACAWQERAAAAIGDTVAAARSMRCALPAISGRSGSSRRAFLLSFADVALATGHPADVRTMLAPLGEHDPAANMRRARMLLTQGDHAGARLLLQRVGISGTPELRAEAAVALLDDRFAAGEMTPDAAVHALDGLSFWRGGTVERRALALRWRIAEAKHDPRAALAAGATLFRYFNLGDQTASTLLRLQGHLRTLVDANGAPIGAAAGLFWDYRDLLPGGGEGETIAARLADRLAAAGLYGRAADLLRFLLERRPADAATGPLSVRVAELDLLADAPDRAIQTLRAGSAIPFPADIQIRRRTIEAAALYRLGKTDEALALLDGSPGDRDLRSEILWQRHDWTGFATGNAADLPGPGALTDANQARVLRQAVALSRTGNRTALAGLRRRYARSFAVLTTRDAFDFLTAPAATLDPAKADKAFAKLALLDAPMPLAGLATGPARAARN